VQAERGVPEALIDAVSASVLFLLSWNIILRAHEHWERYLVVLPRLMLAAPRRYLIVAARRLPAAVVSHRYLAVVRRPLPAAPFLVRRKYLIVVPRPLPAAPLYQFHVHRGKVTLAAMYLRRGGVV
jgi:hypothetical protein